MTTANADSKKIVRILLLGNNPPTKAGAIPRGDGSWQVAQAIVKDPKVDGVPATLGRKPKVDFGIEYSFFHTEGYLHVEEYLKGDFAKDHDVIINLGEWACQENILLDVETRRLGYCKSADHEGNLPPYKENGLLGFKGDKPSYKVSKEKVDVDALFQQLQADGFKHTMINHLYRPRGENEKHAGLYTCEYTIGRLLQTFENDPDKVAFMVYLPDPKGHPLRTHHSPYTLEEMETIVKEICWLVAEQYATQRA